MSATVAPPTPVAAGPVRILPVARGLAVAEARRIAGHPLLLLGAVLYCAMITVSSGQGPGSGYDGLLTGPTFFLGVFTYFAANLAASRPRRDGNLDEQTSYPAPPPARTAGLCLAALVPALLAAALMAGALTWYAAGRVDLPVWPSAAELAAGPLTVLGGALLGIMVARWLPFPIAPALLMVGVIAVALALSTGSGGRYELLSPYATFSVYVDDGSWGGHRPGSPAWHALYLAALCAMAALGSLLIDVRRKLPVVLLGVAATTVAVLAGWAQLP
jgi:hypothetical protein